MLFPTLSFSFGSLILPTFSVFLYCFVSSTALLAIAASESGGTVAYIACFGVWSFWNCTSLRWDKSEGSKVSIILIAVVFQTVLIWPTFVTVQDGFTVPDASLLPNTQLALQGYLADTVAIATSMGVGTHQLTIQSGVLQGIVAQVRIDDENEASTYLPGGMWLVKGMWTYSGVNNPLASYQNMMVFTCWMILFLGVAVLLPPARTIRSAVWRGMIPAAMKDAAGILRAHVENVMGEVNDDDDANQNSNANREKEDDDNKHKAMAEMKAAQLQGKCIYHMNALFDGTLAKYTVFEPRLLTNPCSHPPECTAYYLAKLSMLVARVSSASVGIQLFTSREFCYDNLSSGVYSNAADNLEVCAKALATGNAGLLDDISYVNSCRLSSGGIAGEGGEDQNSLKDEDAFEMHHRTEEIAVMSKKWLRAMSATGRKGGADSDDKDVGFCSKESFASMLQNLKPWIRVHISHYIHLFQHLLAPFRKSTWQSLMDAESYDFIKLIWCIKYSMGMVFLLVISVYWPAYRTDFVLAADDDPMKVVYAIQNGGWTMVAYCFATTQTAEGTVKKGILRMAGTVTGAFSAWLALLACESSTFELSYNLYALVAWMTATSFIATFIATERGFGARIALSNSFGFGPIYFVVTQILIVSYVSMIFGPESRDEVIVNRMVANLLGIVMAIVLAVIPPGNYGGDPGHTRKINNFHWHSVQTVVELLISCDDVADELLAKNVQTLDSLSSKILRKSASMQEITVDFEKDAARLQKMTCFKVDPRVKMELGKITRDIYVASFVPRLAAKILKGESRLLLLEKNGHVQQRLEEIRADMANDGITATSQTIKENFHIPSSDLPDREGRDDIDLLLLTIQWLITEMRGHNGALKVIGVNRCGIYQNFNNKRTTSI